MPSTGWLKLFLKILQLLEQWSHMTLLLAIDSQLENTMKVAVLVKFRKQKIEGTRWHLSESCSLQPPLSLPQVPGLWQSAKHQQ